MMGTSQVEIWFVNQPVDGSIKWRMLVLFGVFASALLLCVSVLFAGPVLTFWIAIIPLALPSMIGYAATIERGIWDSTALFPASFAAYNGVLLIRFLSQDVRNHPFYPVTFYDTDYFMAGIFSALAAIFMAVVWVIWKPGKPNFVSFCDVRWWFTTGIVFYTVGIGFYFLQFALIGGYSSALATDRLERFEAMAEAQSLPYIPFVLTGLVMMMVSTRDKKGKRLVAISMAALWCLLVLLQGDRRLVLQAVMAVVCAEAFVSVKRRKIRPKYVFLGIVAYGAFTIAGPLRLVVPLVASGSLPLHKALEAADTDFLLENLKPENTELAGPFFSVLYNVGDVRHYDWGASYFQTLFAVLPRDLYPGKKPPSPSTVLSIRVHKGLGPVSGWGYSPIAEAFLNFGMAGVCLVSSLWMAFFIFISHLRSHRWGLVIAAILSSECTNANRIDFRTVYIESFFCVAVVLLAACVVRGLFSQRYLIHNTRTVPGAI